MCTLNSLTTNGLLRQCTLFLLFSLFIRRKSRYIYKDRKTPFIICISTLLKKY